MAIGCRHEKVDAPTVDNADHWNGSAESELRGGCEVDASENVLYLNPFTKTDNSNHVTYRLPL